MLKMKALSSIAATFTMSAILLGANATNGKQNAIEACADSIPTITVSHSDMSFANTGYSTYRIEGEHLNHDEVLTDNNGNVYSERVNETNRPRTSNEQCTSHWKSGYGKFNIVSNANSALTVRFIFSIAEYGGGRGENMWSLYFGSKDAEPYRPVGDLLVGSGTDYTFWRWTQIEIDHDFTLLPGTNEVFLGTGLANRFCNLDYIDIKVIGHDSVNLNGLGTYTLEGEFLDKSGWTARKDMIDAGQTNYLERPASNLTPSTSNGYSIARYVGGTTFSLDFSAQAETKFTLAVVLALYQVVNFNDLILVTLDGESMPNPTPGSIGGHTDTNLYYYWQSANLGEYTVSEGNHQVNITINTMPNIDCFTFTVTKYNGVGVDNIVSYQPTEAVTSDYYDNNKKLLITDSSLSPQRGFDSIKGASFENAIVDGSGSRLLLTLDQKVSYYEGNYIGVNAASSVDKDVTLKVYCGSKLLGSNVVALSPVEYRFYLSEGDTGFIQIELTNIGSGAIYLKWINIYGYTLSEFVDLSGVDTFGTTLNTKLQCNSAGSRNYSQTDWEDVKEAFNNLTEEEKRVVRASVANEIGTSDLNKGLSKYDYICAKYAGKDTYTTDFIGREYSYSALKAHFGINTFNVFSTDNLSTIAIITAFIGIFSLAFVILKRRKQQY